MHTDLQSACQVSQNVCANGVCQALFKLYSNVFACPGWFCVDIECIAHIIDVCVHASAQQHNVASVCTLTVGLLLNPNISSLGLQTEAVCISNFFRIAKYIEMHSVASTLHKHHPHYTYLLIHPYIYTMCVPLSKQVASPKGQSRRITARNYTAALLKLTCRRAGAAPGAACSPSECCSRPACARPPAACPQKSGAAGPAGCLQATSKISSVSQQPLTEVNMSMQGPE